MGGVEFRRFIWSFGLGEKCDGETGLQSAKSFMAEFAVFCAPSLYWIICQDLKNEYFSLLYVDVERQAISSHYLVNYS